MPIEGSRKIGKKKLKTPGGDIWVPVILEISFTDGSDRGQEYVHTINNSSKADRDVHIAWVGSEAAQPDAGSTGGPTENADSSVEVPGDLLAVERVNVFKYIDGADRYWETQVTFDNKTYDPAGSKDDKKPYFTTHEKTHIVTYSFDQNEDGTPSTPPPSSSNGVAPSTVSDGIDSELIDEFIIIGERGQETHYYLTQNPQNDDEANQQITTDTPDVTDAGTDGNPTNIDPPYRLDPFQNIVRVTGGGVLGFFQVGFFGLPAPPQAQSFNGTLDGDTWKNNNVNYAIWDAAYGDGMWLGYVPSYGISQDAPNIILKSIDGAKTWTFLVNVSLGNYALLNKNIGFLPPPKPDPGTLPDPEAEKPKGTFVCCFYNLQIHTSTDGGQTWKVTLDVSGLFDNGQGDFDAIRGFCMQAGDYFWTEIVFQGSGEFPDNWATEPHVRLYRSADGLTWTPVTLMQDYDWHDVDPGLEGDFLSFNHTIIPQGVAYDPKTKSYLFVAYTNAITSSAVCVRSSDGLSWGPTEIIQSGTTLPEKGTIIVGSSDPSTDVPDPPDGNPIGDILYTAWVPSGGNGYFVIPGGALKAVYTQTTLDLSQDPPNNEIVNVLQQGYTQGIVWVTPASGGSFEKLDIGAHTVIPERTSDPIGFNDCLCSAFLKSAKGVPVDDGQGGTKQSSGGGFVMSKGESVASRGSGQVFWLSDNKGQNWRPYTATPEIETLGWVFAMSVGKVGSWVNEKEPPP